MNFKVLTEKWCNLSPDALVIIVTDNEQNFLAKEIADDITDNCRIIYFDANGDFMPELRDLRPCDLIVALFGFETYVEKGANNFFSPFDKPEGVSSKYVFIRLSISKESLLQGLSTPKEMIYDKISELSQYTQGSRVRVTNAAGTDIFLTIDGFPSLESEIIEVINDGEMAFLPPSEVSAVVQKGKSDGKIAVDVTVGGLYYYGEHIESFGLVKEQQVILTVKNGLVTDITGGGMAALFKEKLFALPSVCRELVELGHGLSKMTPTGNGGVDESIIDTCHFGMGDGWGGSGCGVHLDVIIWQPTITGA